MDADDLKRLCPLCLLFCPHPSSERRSSTIYSDLPSPTPDEKVPTLPRLVHRSLLSGSQPKGLRRSQHKGISSSRPRKVSAWEVLIQRGLVGEGQATLSKAYQGIPLVLGDRNIILSKDRATLRNKWASTSFMALKRERTLAMIKPDGIYGNFTDRIKQVILENGFFIVQELMVQLVVENATLFYSEHSAKSFFPNLVEYMTSGPVLAMVIEKTNGISEWRALIGPTDAGKARVSHPHRWLIWSEDEHDRVGKQGQGVTASGLQRARRNMAVVSGMAMLPCPDLLELASQGTDVPRGCLGHSPSEKSSLGHGCGTAWPCLVQEKQPRARSCPDREMLEKLWDFLDFV
ncbi:hypothetical protein ZIOFF_016133 [Zingiber officinale]|uniref:Nucleoside diphosphate kinase-like domain-containing protein n=1 Tax=Zingiber officinale TaxID=94328 RepID=A0A8J5LX30_ZINOF|nr:hypothetical protein ZIOFF_016133 [Zingiber officinale]